MLSKKKIEDFIKEYARSRVIVLTSVRAVCNHVMEYEKKIKKSVTNFSKEEIITFYKNLGAISVTSLMNTNLIIKHLLNWIFFTEGINQSNICNEISKDALKECIVQRILIDREQLDELQAQLLNKTDVAILECLWLGMGSRWNTEITYLEPKQVSRTNMKVYFKSGKIIDINQKQYDILQEAFEETELLSYTPDSMKVSRVNGRSIYKARFNAIHDNDDKNSEEDIERRFRFMQRRMKIMSDYLDIKLTPSLIQTSGMVHYMYEGMMKSGLGFRDFLHTAQAKQIVKRYDINSPLYVQIAVEKVGAYLE